MTRTKASAPATAPNPAAQFEMRGYLITEAADLALKDLTEAMDAVAILCEERGDDMPEMPPAMWGGLLRTFARTARAVHADAAFANHASARPRDIN